MGIGGMACEGALIAPTKIDGALHSLQFTAPNGDKRFLPGGRTAGTSYALGTAADLEKHDVMLLAEGFSTGATVREATGYVVLVRFFANNLAAVATFQRNKFPDIQIIIAGDVDKSGTGQRAATDAAKVVNGLAALLRLSRQSRPL